MVLVYMQSDAVGSSPMMWALLLPTSADAAALTARTSAGGSRAAIVCAGDSRSSIVMASVANGPGRRDSGIGSDLVSTKVLRFTTVNIR